MASSPFSSGQTRSRAIMVKASKSGKPKRALAAYMFFQMDRTPKLRAANPGMAQTEIFKLVGEEWRNATDKIKEPYVKRAEEDKVRHQAEMEQWDRAHPNGVEEESTGRKKKAKKDPNAPKRPKSAYLFFTSEKMASIRAQNPDMVQKEIMKRAGEMWKELSEDQKKKFQDMAARDKTRYEKEMGK